MDLKKNSRLPELHKILFWSTAVLSMATMITVLSGQVKRK